MLLDANDKKSLTELNYIINNMSEGLYKKIPKEMIQYIKENMDNEYILNIDITKKVSEQEFLPQTKAWLSLIMSEYLVDDFNKEKWRKFDGKYEECLNEKNKFDSDIFFSKNKHEQENETKVQMVEYKTSIIRKILKKFLKIFKRKE